MPISFSNVCKSPVGKKSAALRAGPHVALLIDFVVEIELGGRVDVGGRDVIKCSDCEILETPTKNTNNTNMIAANLIGDIFWLTLEN
jgi:hypothetical protein